MRKYAIILLVLILIGLALTVKLFTQDQKLDQTVFLQTSESIRNLQTLDKNLRLLLNQSRFNNRFDHDQLSDTNYQISEEFDNLRFDALFEEIESSPELSQAVSAFEESFATREEKLDSYIDANMQIAEALIMFRSVAEKLQENELVRAEPSLEASLASTQTALFALMLGEELSSELSIIEPDFQIPEDVAKPLADYQNAINTIRDQYPITVALYDELIQLDSGELLNNIESSYANYHNQAIAGSNSLRNALVAYGIALLTALLFFGYQIWRNYTSLEQQVADRTEEIKSAYEELRKSQEQLIQTEKMASLGQMVAGVAHEINTPLGYISSNIDTLKLNLSDLSGLIERLEELSKSVLTSKRNNQDVTQKLVSMLTLYKDVEAYDLMEESNQLLGDGAFGLAEISRLVTSLKDFARLDRQNTERVNLHDCLESSLTIASNHIKENNVTVVREFADIPAISCFPSKLNQLFLNLITNACQAMADRNGTLTIRTRHDNDDICIDFEDQGIGMDEETQQRMFDPFFTSKEIGQGTGLGLSISYKIIEAHNGRIEVDSEVGRGTKLTVIIPAEQS